MLTKYASLIMVCLLWPLLLYGQDYFEPSHQLTGTKFEYEVKPGDHLTRISARYGIETRAIIQNNQFASPAKLIPGTQLKLDNRHIVPERLQDGILINIPQRMLFFFKHGSLMYAYPIALGKPTWRTPTGDFQIKELMVNKTWKVPLSIQREMASQGKPLLKEVPPGPNNPLGKYWIGLSISGYGIHGTNAPASIYRFQTHGCIRLHPDDIAQLFPQAQKGMQVKIIYQSIMLAEIANQDLFIEVHQDIYKKSTISLADIKAAAAERQITEKVNWDRVEEAIKQNRGIVLSISKE